MNDNLTPFVFVLMPFSEEFSDIYEVGIKAACENVGARCERVDEQIFLDSILNRVYDQISQADIIVAEMTGRNPNVFYETGYAHALKKQVILLTKHSDDIPFDLKHYPHIVYGDKIATLKTKLEAQVQWCIEHPQAHAKQSNFYGIKITSHDNSADVNEVPFQFWLSGTAERLIPEGTLQGFVRDGSNYWPAMRPGQYSIADRMWRIKLELGGKPGPRLIVVATVNETAQRRIAEYYRVGDEKDQWNPLPAPSSNIFECDRVVINRL